MTDDTMGISWSVLFKSVLPGTLILEHDNSVWIILAMTDDGELELGHALDGSMRITEWNEHVDIPRWQTRISFDGEVIT